MCKKALDFEQELKEAKQESKKIKEDLMILKTQKGLLARYIYIYIYIRVCVCVFVSLMCVCVVYVVKEVMSFRGARSIIVDPSMQFSR